MEQSIFQLCVFLYVIQKMQYDKSLYSGNNLLMTTKILFCLK